MFSGCAELDIWITLLGQRQINTRWSKVSQMPAAIHRQVIGTLAFKLFQFFAIRAFNPASSGHVHLFVYGLYLVLIFQTIGYDLKLQYAHRAYDDIVAVQGEKYLSGAFFGQLLQAFLQLLGFQRILQTNTAEQLGGKMGDTGEFQLLTRGEGITKRNSAVIVQPDDITSQRLFYCASVTGHKGNRISDSDIFSQTHMTHLHALVVNPGADS